MQQSSVVWLFCCSMKCHLSVWVRAGAPPCAKVDSIMQASKADLILWQVRAALTRHWQRQLRTLTQSCWKYWSALRLKGVMSCPWWPVASWSGCCVKVWSTSCQNVLTVECAVRWKSHLKEFTGCFKPSVPECAALDCTELGYECIHDAFIDAGIEMFEAGPPMKPKSHCDWLFDWLTDWLIKHWLLDLFIWVR